LILVNVNLQRSLKLPVISRIHERGYAMYEFLQETVANNMTPKVRSVTPETTVGDLYRLFAADDFDAYPVVRDDTLVGMISKLDALKVFAFSEDQILPHFADGMGTTVDRIMTSDVITVEPEAKLQRVLQLMVRHRLKSLPVIDKRRNLVGIVARDDVMRAMERWALRHDPPIVPFEQA
jgi:CBS domain-containing protein